MNPLRQREQQVLAEGREWNLALESAAWLLGATPRLDLSGASVLGAPRLWAHES